MSLWGAVKRYWNLRGAKGLVTVGAGTVIEGRILARGAGRVSIGAGVVLDASQTPIVLMASAGAEIILGDGVVIESGVSIEATQSVRIGPRSRVGAFSMILDSNHHQVEGDRQSTPDANPVVVEEDVLIGPRAILLPGTFLGRGTQVAPCTVVSRRTPEGALVSGHPAMIRRPT